jgi:hypothetical protein
VPVGAVIVVALAGTVLATIGGRAPAPTSVAALASTNVPPSSAIPTVSGAGSPVSVPGPLDGFIGTYEVTSSGFRVDSSLGATVTIVENGNVVEWHQASQPNTDEWFSGEPETGALVITACTPRRCEGTLEDGTFWAVYVDSDGVVRTLRGGFGICGLPDVAGAGEVDATKDGDGTVTSFRYVAGTGGGSGGDDGCQVAFVGAYDVVAVRR